VDGTHALTIHANDTLGNLNATENISFTIDTSVPSPSPPSGVGESPAPPPPPPPKPTVEAPPAETLPEEKPLDVVESLAPGPVATATVSLSNPTSRTVRLKPKLEEVIDVPLENEEQIKSILKEEEGLCGNDVDGNVEVLRLLQREKVQPIYKQKYSELFTESTDKLLDKRRQGLKVRTMSGMIFGDSFICANLLKSQLLDADEIILAPGEKMEKELKIKSLSVQPRRVKVVFTEAGQTFAEQELLVQNSLITGTAIDASLPGNFFDFYLIIADDNFAANGNANGNEQYLLELTLNKKESARGLKKWFSWLYDPAVLYSELYGPYVVNRNTVLFAQQMEYEPEQYHGDYVIKTKVYLKDKVIAEDEFEVNLD